MDNVHNDAALAAAADGHHDNTGNALGTSGSTKTFITGIDVKQSATHHDNNHHGFDGATGDVPIDVSPQYQPDYSSPQYL
jgi:hypothetical protein